VAVRNQNVIRFPNAPRGPDTTLTSHLIVRVGKQRIAFEISCEARVLNPTLGPILVPKKAADQRSRFSYQLLSAPRQHANAFDSNVVRRAPGP
jgi:hypothetical protein